MSIAHIRTHTITYNALSYSDRNSNYYQSNWWNGESYELPLKHVTSSFQLIFFLPSISFFFHSTYTQSILPVKMCLVHTRTNVLSKHLWVHNSFNRWTSFCVTEFFFVSSCSGFVCESALAPMVAPYEAGEIGKK